VPVTALQKTKSRDPSPLQLPISIGRGERAAKREEKKKNTIF